MTPAKNSFVFAAADTTKEAMLFENGFITAYTLVCPNYTGNGTTTLSVKDDDGVTIWTGDAKAENATYLVTGLNIPVDKGYKLVATLSVAAGGDHTAVAKVFIEHR